MLPLNYAQMVLLKFIAGTLVVVSVFWILLSGQDLSTPKGALITIGLGILFLVVQTVTALFLGRRITLKVLYEGRLRQRLRKAKKALSHVEQQNHLISDHLFEGVIIIDEQDRIVSINRSARRILKMKRNFKKESLASAIREPEIHELLANAREQKRTIEKNIRLPDVELVRIAVRAYPLHNGYFMLSLLDISRTSGIDQKHDDFIAHASHELKTPISVIYANAELLLELDSENSAERPLQEAIFRQARRAKNLLDSLLELLRLDAGVTDTTPELIPLHEFVGDIKKSLGHFEAIVRNEVAQEVKVWTDRKLLERLVLIIIENAQKYAGANALLSITAVESRSKIKIKFSDNGPGIKSHLRERVFERFFREPHHDNSNKEGFGLGLTRARAIANSLGGKIYIEDSPKGCVLVLSLAVDNTGSEFAIKASHKESQKV